MAHLQKRCWKHIWERRRNKDGASFFLSSSICTTIRAMLTPLRRTWFNFGLHMGVYAHVNWTQSLTSILASFPRFKAPSDTSKRSRRKKRKLVLFVLSSSSLFQPPVETEEREKREREKTASLSLPFSFYLLPPPDLPFPIQRVEEEEGEKEEDVASVGRRLLVQAALKEVTLATKED